MSKSCPISTYRVDTNIIRFISFQVAFVSFLFIISGSTIFILLLVYDFIIRALRARKYSPFFFLAKKAANHFCNTVKMSDEAPKRFALFIGLVFSVLILLFSMLNLKTISIFIAVTLIICASLEAIFNYCVGCKIYQLLQSLKKISNQ